MLRNTIGALLLCALAAPASADWQYTKWGMSPDEVKKASHGAAVPLAPSDAAYVRPGMGATAQLVAPYISGDYRWRAFFYFDSGGRLLLVVLSGEGGDADAILADLRAKYGKPEREDLSTLRVITWQDADNRIEYMSVGDRLPSITYRARVSTNSKGL